MPTADDERDPDPLRLTERADGVIEERAAVVAWLDSQRGDPRAERFGLLHCLARRIERGEHLR